MTRIEHAQELRSRTDVHINCAQAVMMVFANKMGITEEQAQALGTYFGSGMGRGRTCGTLTGALMVLGMAGGTNSDVHELWQRFGDAHVGTDCRDLLAVSAAAGTPRKVHCDGLIYEVIGILEDLLA